MNQLQGKPLPRWDLANIVAIPGTGVRGYRHYFRGPRNIDIKRALLNVFDGLRGMKVPPDSYEDISISNDRSRSWKRHRKTQWREPKP